MTLKTVSAGMAALAACLTLSTGAAKAADPVCAEFLSPDAMPKKYRKLAPALSDAATGWIVTRDQMKGDYALDAEGKDLLAQIVAEFEARGTRLAILMPPPRPLVAGRDAMSAMAGEIGEYDHDAVSASFDEMVAAAVEAGAIMPNLRALATGDEGLRQAYFFPHDTHWTPTGAAESAVALAGAVAEAGLRAFPAAGTVAPEYPGLPEGMTEKGSLAQMADKVCGAKIAPITVAHPTWPIAGGSLLGDAAAGAKVLLAGSSFSDRYQRDAYGVADALAATLGADVENLSVTGGGALGALEGAILSGKVVPGAYDLVVWELPSTRNLNDIGTLRQLLGALRVDPAAVASGEDMPAKGEWKAKAKGQPRLLTLHLNGADVERLKVDLRTVDGEKTTLNVVRYQRVPAEIRSDVWAIDLGTLPVELASIGVRYDGKKMGPAPRATLR